MVKCLSKLQQQAICILYTSKEITYTQVYLGTFFGCSRTTIRKVLRENRIPLKSRSTACKLYTIQNTLDNKFECTEEAYWIGFITGDGSVNSKSLTIHLSGKDKDHLINFNAFLQSTYSVKNNLDGSVYLSITDQSLLNNLTNVGIVPNKSQLTFKYVPNKNTSHWVRGLFDADGTVVKSGKQCYAGIYNKHKISLEKLQYILQKQGIHASIYKVHQCYLLRIYRVNSFKKFYSYLYNNSTTKTRLTRKYLKYTNITMAL